VRSVPALLLACVVSHASPAAPATRSADAVLDALASTATLRDVAISPDGTRVAFARHKGGPSAVYVVEASGSAAPRRVTAARKGADANEKEPAFSPDGAKLAFLSDADSPGQLQVWLLDLGAKAAPVRLTTLKGDLGDLRFSRDGRALTFLFIENATHGANPLGPTARDAGVVAAKAEERRIAVLDLATKKTRLVSPADLYVYEYDAAPDGKTFAVTAAHGEGDDNWWIATLMLVNEASGEAKTIYTPPPDLQLASPRYSPDGESVAFIGGIMSDQGSTGGDVFVVARSGGAAKNLTEGMKASASTLQWLSKDTLLFGEEVAGESGLATVPRGGGAIATLYSGPEHVSASALTGVALSSDGKTSAVVRESFSAAPEVWAGPIGAWKKLTHENDSETVAWGAAKKIGWTSDGMTVHGWLLAPPEAPAPGTKAPMIVLAHGGPAGSVHPNWPTRWSGILASQGYYVFMPNPRGSFGEGEEFTRGNVKDFGYGDLRDILRGVDAVLAKEPVDGARVGLAGWSYGGYMAMWAVTQTNRFAAAVAGAGIVSWQSYYGQNRIDMWMLPYFGASVYDDPWIYERSSPITFIKNVKTPTLVLHGERDAEVPAPQGYEFWHALKTLGVPTQLVIYPDEGHRIAKPEHSRDVSRRVLDWFGKYLKKGA
jgi:dipeptidyl aminopeptidase/acylaminoacyl peptidase